MQVTVPGSIGLDARDSRAFPCSKPVSGSGPFAPASHRVFQKTSFPLQKAKCLPLERAASTFLRWLPLQYCHGREEIKIFA